MNSAKKKLITFISVHNPEDITTWSGINYFLLQSLRRHFEVQVISGLSFRHTALLKIHARLNKIMGYQFYYELSDTVTKQLARFVTPLIDKESLCIITVNSHIVTNLNTNKPIILFDDATLSLLDGYYDFFSNQHPYYKGICLKNEQLAFDKCYHVYMSSQWAADSVITHYHQSVEKVSVWPFGANLLSLPSTACILKNIELRKIFPFRLLWAGVDRKRKGADIAIELTHNLRAAGYEVSLSLVGILPNENENHPDFIQFWGKLNKAIPTEHALLCEIFLTSHLFVFPTQIDCSPVVISEAAAFGLPVIAPNLAGLPSLVTHGKTGYLVNSIAEYQTVIENCIVDWQLYKTLSKEARYFYDTNLSWDVNTSKFAAYIKANFKELD